MIYIYVLLTEQLKGQSGHKAKGKKGKKRKDKDLAKVKSIPQAFFKEFAARTFPVDEALSIMWEMIQCNYSYQEAKKVQQTIKCTRVSESEMKNTSYTNKRTKRYTKIRITYHIGTIIIMKDRSPNFAEF